MLSRRFALPSAAMLIFTGTALAQAPLEAGPVIAHQAETPHPYPKGNNARSRVWSDWIVSPGATFVRVHFKAFHLAAGDYVTISSPDGEQSYTYTDRGPNGDGEFWAFAVSGDTAIVELHGGPEPGHGYQVDSVGHGTAKVFPKRAKALREVVCGTEGRQDVACHLPEVDAAQKPVARLLFVSGAWQYLCTGWLVKGNTADTMLTNNHCFSTQKVVATVQATFNFQRLICGVNGNAAVSNYAGGSLLRTNSSNRKGKSGGLDYTLFTLKGSPAAQWGVLTASVTSGVVGNPIWLIQHGGGYEKQIGYWDDAAKTVRCKVNAVGATYSGTAPGSQTGYSCDTEGGSSGSPVIDAGSGKVIALHHYGAVVNDPCLNGGTTMANVCADAGALLQCQ
ncbi:MAG: trypsin-like peptidase domain-containing protein [Acidobacteria bacterium]|nr:trypsin-like peptidase domain-containing protein [Acidobacteriota bacterium]